MDWKYLFTDLDGRINRRSYWMGAFSLIVVWLAALAFGYAMGGEALAIIFGLVLLYPFFAVNVKRAHDRGRPTWLIVIFFGLLLIASVLQLLGLGQTDDGPTTPYVIVGALWLVLALYLFVELACLPGTAGPNPYGPDPLEGRG